MHVVIGRVLADLGAGAALVLVRPDLHVSCVRAASG